MAILNSNTKLIYRPRVHLLEDDCEEALYINGKLIMCHDRLYPSEILDALEKAGMIQYTHKNVEHLRDEDSGEIHFPKDISSWEGL